MNVVSTSPSATEICYALGVEPVAVSHACDHPPAARELPRIDASRIEGDASGRRHREVADADSGDGIYDVDLAQLRAAEPDLILSQAVCGVCAVDETLIRAALSDVDADPEVLGLDASRLADVFACIREVGDATGRAARAEELIEELRERVDAVARRTGGIEDRPRTAVIEWMDPVHVAGNWVPELVELAGGAYGLADPGAGSREIGWEAVLAYGPAVLVVAPCSYGVEDTRERIDELAGRDGWERLPAVEAGRVYAMDGASYLSRWTPRLVDALERLAAVLHPEVFDGPDDGVARLAGAGAEPG